MSKFLTKTVRKSTLLTVIIVIILALATVLGAIFGFHKNAVVSDTQMLTVSVSQYLYRSDMEKLKDECDKALSSVDVVYEIYGEMDGDESEIVFVFNDTEDVTEARKKLVERFEFMTSEGGSWEGWTITVGLTPSKTVSSLAKGYVVRGIIAAAVIAVLALVYAVIRYKWCMGLTVGLCTLLGMGLTTAVILICRVLVTSTVMYAIIGSGLMTAIAVLFTFNKLRANLKSESAADKSVEDVVVESIAVKEVLLFGGLLGIALFLIGILGGSALAWFSLSSVIGLVVAAFLGLVYAPAVYLPLRKCADNMAANNPKSGYKAVKAKKKEILEDD
ncbi:MAG: hypothetical protein IJX49_03610 [Clostridia bacterium]|nr:hypothetical protein [Clostridia bacterium]